jgi:DNA-binding SARP family transcriptional activator
MDWLTFTFHLLRALLTKRTDLSGVVPKCFASSLVTKIDDAVKVLPHREAVRYTEKNMKWAAQDFMVSWASLGCPTFSKLFTGFRQMYAEAHANALLEHEFLAGETIALWMPECAEKVWSCCSSVSILDFTMTMYVISISP